VVAQPTPAYYPPAPTTTRKPVYTPTAPPVYTTSTPPVYTPAPPSTYKPPPPPVFTPVSSRPTLPPSAPPTQPSWVNFQKLNKNLNSFSYFKISNLTQKKIKIKIEWHKVHQLTRHYLTPAAPQLWNVSWKNIAA
jgi:hypothetical protein